MPKAFILIRKSDNRVVGVNKVALSPDPADPVEEFNEDIPTRSWIQFEIFRTGVNTYNITSTEVKPGFESTFDSDVDSQIGATSDVATLKVAVTNLLKRCSVR